MLKFLNPKTWAIGLAKKIAINLVTKEGDKLQKKVRTAVIHEGPDAVNKAFDGSQAKMIAAIWKAESWFPEWMGFLKPIFGKMVVMVQQQGDELQARVRRDVEIHGFHAVDLAFDSAQAILIARIKAI